MAVMPMPDENSACKSGSSSAEKPDLNMEQVNAVLLSKKIGERLVSEYPQIADDYKLGLTQNEIIDKYSLMDAFSLSSLKVAKRAIVYALNELLSEDELRELEKTHEICGGKKGAQSPGSRIAFKQMLADLMPEQRSANARKAYAKTIGKMTPKQRSESSRKGGLSAYNRGVGFFAQTREQFTDAGRKGAIKQGKVPMSDEEKAYFCELCNNPEYQTPNGRVRMRELSDELYQKFGIRRTPATLSVLRRRYAKRV